MGVLEDSLITLENGDKIDVKYLKLNDDKLLSCQIEGMNHKSINKEAILWSQVNPKIEIKGSLAFYKWKQKTDKYILVNGILKISLDTVILFKDFEGETTWGYCKSLRKGYFLFTDRFEYEEIKSIKRVKGNVETICLSVDPYSYYFVNGYLVHNTSLCDNCDTCHYWPAILQQFGPHAYNSTSNPVSTTHSHTYKQNQLYGYDMTGYSSSLASHTRSLNSEYKLTSSSSWTLGGQSADYRTVPWNYFAKNMRLYNPYTQSNRPSGTIYYYLYKYASWSITESVSSGSGNGWRAFVGTDSGTTNALAQAKAEVASGNGVPHDLWYHSHYRAGSTNKSLRLGYTGTFGVRWYSGIKSGSTITWSSEKYSIGTPFTSSTHDLTVNENTHGGRGNSKVYIIFKIPVPANSTQYVSYDLRWLRGDGAVIEPTGWFAFHSYRAGETI